MKTNLNWCCAIAILVALTTTSVQADYLQQLQQQAHHRQLHLDKHWLNLLHYEAGLLFSTSYSSLVDDPRFFLAQHGKHSPQAELNATLAAFFAVDKGDDSHALCRFVARYRWLSEVLAIYKARLPSPLCAAYHQWKQQLQAQRLTLVFPASYLNSPSSMYGHTLLRLDSDKSTNQGLLAYAVNFGANAAEQDNSIFYAFKGLTGGYPGQFVLETYFRKLQEYSRMENRDIWEYTLNFSKHEVDRVVEHLWELDRINFDYYFLSENCSYRLLELFEIARPQLELTEQFFWTVIPVDTVRLVKESGLVLTRHYRPSQATSLTQLKEQIPRQQRYWIKRLAKQPGLANSPDYLALDAQLQGIIMSAAYRYLRYSISRQARSPLQARNSHQLLLQRSRYSASKIIPVMEPVAPELGHQTSMLQFGGGVQNHQDYLQLGFRFSYHDLLDLPAGYLSGAQIVTGDLRLRLYEQHRFRLEQFDLFNIRSLSPYGDLLQPLSWQFRIGVERKNDDGNAVLVPHISAGAGIRYALSDDDFVFGLLGARLEHNARFKRFIEPGVSLGLGVNHRWQRDVTHIEYRAERFLNGYARHQVGVEHNLVLANNHAFRFSFKQHWHRYQNYRVFNLAYRYYF